ncbi:MAG TPA: hypothetical protein PLA43_21245 [Bryobacteraceae bacterium]|nr:hypothetical protein [Bryobacteraceae bacterium]HOQ46013.1 hypothetical protein [Bryobacteraceae bacterium]HPU74488.1 hypothetical protein [Bryobacteraceae bacterium]
MREPFAVEIYKRHLAGENIQQLAATLEIPPDRIEKRLRAAAEYLKTRRNAA